ncbi:MAG: hypothetical protein GY861_12410, partial [bacterium]|nr:hypothetical protein [bacterium]
TVTGMAQVQSRAAPVSVPIKDFISNEPLQKQCQEKLNKASKQKKETGKELQQRQKERIQQIAPGILKSAKELRITIPMVGTEERKIRHKSPDTIVLVNSDDEPEIIKEIKVKESAEPEKVAELEKEDSEGDTEVSIADKEKETAMDTETMPSIGVPEVAASVPVTPMEISATSEPQPSAAILDQSSTSSLVPCTLKCALHLYYPFDSSEDLNEVEKDLRESLPHQVVAEVQSFTELVQRTDLHLIPSNMITFLDSILSVLQKTSVNRNFINSLIILVTKEVFRQCKVSEPSSVLPFYWHPNFHSAADTMGIKTSRMAKFSQENLNHPHATPEHYTKAISITPGWNASYPSMALDKDATRIEHCQTLLESLSGKEDPK